MPRGRENIHVDQDDTKGPDVGGSRAVSGRTVVSTLEAHVWGTSTVHVRTLCIGRRKAEIGQLDDDAAFPVGETVRDDKVLRFDITVKDTLVMTGGDGIAHLRKHARNQAQTRGAEELRGVEGSEQGRGRRSPGGGGSGVL